MPDRASAQYALRGRLSPMGSPCGGDPRYAMVLRPANCVAEKDFPGDCCFANVPEGFPLIRARERPCSLVPD
jgi:hypothetical protein